MIKAVVFDLDDTLAPEYGYVLSGYEALSPYLAEKTELKAGEVFERLCVLFEEDGRRVFNRFFEGLGLEADPEEIRKLVNMYRSHEPGERYGLYPDVGPALKALRELGIKTGILTDGFAEAQRKKLAALGLWQAQAKGDPAAADTAAEEPDPAAADMAPPIDESPRSQELRFDFIEVTAELGDEYKKPSAEGFLLAARELGVEAGELVYVGDNPEKDFYIKKYLPVTTMRIKRERGVYLGAEYREGIREDHLIASLAQVAGLLR